MQNFYIDKEEGKKTRKTYFELPVVKSKRRCSKTTKAIITGALICLAAVLVICSTVFALKTINKTASDFSAVAKKAVAKDGKVDNSLYPNSEYPSNIDKSLTIFILNVSNQPEKAQKALDELRNDGFNRVSIQQYIGDSSYANPGVYVHEKTSEPTAQSLANKLKLTYFPENIFTTSGWNIIIMI